MTWLVLAGTFKSNKWYIDGVLISDHDVQGIQYLSRVWIRIAYSEGHYLIPVVDLGSTPKQGKLELFQYLLNGFSEFDLPGYYTFYPNDSWIETEEGECKNLFLSSGGSLVIFKNGELKWYGLIAGETLYKVAWNKLDDFIDWYANEVLFQKVICDFQPMHT